MKTELIVIQLNLLCLSLFTVLLLYVASVLGCFVVRDFCRGGFRQNFANFYLTPPPPSLHPTLGTGRRGPWERGWSKHCLRFRCN